MQDLFIEFLPPWVETGLQPAFYDRESGTVLQQTARMYAKVNELVKAVNGMDKIIKEYVDYIDHYFENLDVQEEINNKLDAMAEGGELAEFIAQYANLPCVHAYDTIADMASSANLVDGSFARAMSKTVAGTGDGAYYKIRETVEGDDPDGENLVTITGTTLVAEIIPDALAGVIDIVQDNIDAYIADNVINAKFAGAKGDGVTDDYAVLQGLIDDNPHKTIYLPDGTYLISDTLHISTGNANQVNLKLDHNAVITTDQSIDYLLEVGTEEGSYDRYAEGSIVWIDGGIFNCGNAGSAIYLSANQKQTKVSNTIIYGVDQYGIYIDRGINTSSSSDADIMNVSINGKGSEVGGVGVYAYGYDNKISHVRVNKCQIGVYDAGGSFYTDVHALYSYTSNSVTVQQYEATKGFVFAGAGTTMCEQCYADTFANGFVLEGVGTAHVFLNESMCYWYTAVDGAKVNAIKVARNDQPYKLKVSNFELTCPNSAYSVDFDALWLNGKQEYIAVYDFISLNNINLMNVSTYENGGVLKKNDWITCQAFYDKDSVQIKDAWAVTMTQNTWYPVAYLRQGISHFKLRMANDQMIEVTAKVGDSCTISTKNIFSNAHANEFEVGLCNATQETDRGNEWGAILAVRSSSSNSAYNPALSDGLQNWNTQIFTHRSFMDTTPLSSPTVNASASFNPV